MFSTRPPAEEVQRTDTVHSSPRTLIKNGWISKSFRVFQQSDTSAELCGDTIRSLNAPAAPTPASPAVVIACIACERAVLLSNPPPDFRTGLGLHSLHMDTFLPTTCYQCEQDSNVIYNRMTRTGATIKHDWPGFISERMLQTWWLYTAVNQKYKAVLHFDGGHTKMLARIRDIRKSMLRNEARAELLAFDADGTIREIFDWRLDSFFGQPLG